MLKCEMHRDMWSLSPSVLTPNCSKVVLLPCWVVQQTPGKLLPPSTLHSIPVSIRLFGFVSPDLSKAMTYQYCNWILIHANLAHRWTILSLFGQFLKLSACPSTEIRAKERTEVAMLQTKPKSTISLFPVVLHSYQKKMWWRKEEYRKRLPKLAFPPTSPDV